ncbi:MAG: selenocysteine-specific translation elongation factor [Planctomycetota bacterium]|jgi:selenocysteine-specific elongation factor
MSLEIVPVMVGTAGHVDHGKSSLVQLLTGCEMDRHPEALARGLTIDLGFAACRLPGSRLAGVVDVPGHEDFIRNMVAGAASMDVLMLVIAADDGIMPQTREHMEIVKALRTPQVMAVVTKIDLVDEEMRELVREEVEAFLAETGFPEAPVVLASNQTLTGIESVRTTLQGLIEAVDRPRDDRAFRMPVERVFQVKGYGTVVTGIPISGRLTPGDEVVLAPAGSRHGVRSIQSYKIDQSVAQAHVCAAINLRDLDAEQVERGMVLSHPEAYEPTSFLLVTLTHQGLAGPLKRSTAVKVHAGTAAVNATLKLIDEDRLLPGCSALAQIHLQTPHLVAAGDRVLIRTLTPTTTLGGGTVLTAREYRIRRNAIGFQDRLMAAREAVQQGNSLAADLLAGPSALLSEEELLCLTQREGVGARALIDTAVSAGTIVDLKGGDWLVSMRTGEVCARLQGELERYHQAHPYVWGMERDQAARLLGIQPGSLRECLRQVTQAGRMGMQHDRLALNDFEPSLSAKQMAQREALLAAVAEGGIAAPAVGNLKKSLGLSDAEMKLLIRLLVEEGEVIRIGPHLVDAAVLTTCREALSQLFTAQIEVELGDFRTATGASRNVAVALLEFFDREGLTRRVDSGRILA